MYASSTIALQVHMQMHNLAGAKAELAALADPDSASFGKFLTDDEFNAQKKKVLSRSK